jgi:catechol 2,3-dioxygenase
MKLKGIGHVALRVTDEERSRAFYRDVLGLRISEEDPEHGGIFMSQGLNFHTLDLFAHPDPATAPQPQANQVGLAHVAFAVASYRDLREAYCSLLAHDVKIERAVDHVSQRSIYFADPDGNRLEVYYEMPGALERFTQTPRGDLDVMLPLSRPGEALPAWLNEAWPPSSG